MIRYILLLLFALFGIASAERYEYTSLVGLEIPDSDSTGVRDTIFIDQHIHIEDINIYVGIGPNTMYAEEVWVTVNSPRADTVWLNNCAATIFRFYFWYDTDHPEDGPGELEDYAGEDAYGNWEMFCVDHFEQYILHWYSWRIEVIGTPIVGLAEEKSPMPTEYEFSGVYPNPFNSTVSLAYGLPEPAAVNFTIFDIQGRKIKKIDCGLTPAGYHNVDWNGADETGEPVASGVYFVRMAAGEREFTKRAVLLK